MPPADRHLGLSPTEAAEEDADAREFADFAHAQEPLDLQAATWVARRRNGLQGDDEARLQHWLNADPRHAAAFDEMDGVFGKVGRLPDDDVAALKRSMTQPGHRRAAAPTRTPGFARSPERTPARRRWLPGLQAWIPHATAAALALTVAGGAWMGWKRWQQFPVFEQAFATQRGQQLNARLPDAPAAGAGSVLQLDTGSRTEVRLYRDRREVHIQEGQAMFTVHADARRPFHVMAGPLRIVVTGTRFSVRHTRTGLDAGQTAVSVEEGRVLVARAPSGQATLASAPTAIELVAGQRVTADAEGHIGPVASMPPGAVASWRDGRLDFDQTPLATAIAEFERYGPTRLVVRDPAVAALRVGGSYRPRDAQGFAETLPRMLPVRLVQRGDTTEVVAP